MRRKLLQGVHWSVEIQVHPYQRSRKKLPVTVQDKLYDDNVDKNTDIFHIGKSPERIKSVVNVSFSSSSMADLSG